MPRSVTVSNATQLTTALANSQAGDTILLSGGNYGKLQLSKYAKFDVDFPDVTIASANPGNPAVFSGFDIRHTKNLTFDGVVFDYTFKPGESLLHRPFIFSESANVTVRNSVFDGDMARGGPASANGYGTATGIMVIDTNKMTLENNEFYDFYIGTMFTRANDAVVRGNDVHSMRSDGMVFVQMDGVLIEGNKVHDMRTSPTSNDHPDMIQFWTEGTTKASRDIVIRDNVLDIGEGSWSQSIFMGNELVGSGRAGSSMFYQNVLIENNTITNAHWHGITVAETNGLTIRQNSVLHADGGKVDGADHPVEVPRINVSGRSTNVTVSQNLTAEVTGLVKRADWSASNNVLVQDQNRLAANHYEKLFVTTTLGQTSDGEHRFIAKSGGLIDQVDAGSSATRSAATVVVSKLDASFEVAEADIATRVFDATLVGVDMAALPAGTTFTWTFGDGTTAQGQKVSHSYDAGGKYDVSLQVKLPDGKSVSEKMRVEVECPGVVALESDGKFWAYDCGTPVSLGAAPKMTPDGMQLGAVGVTAQVARTHLSQVVGADEMTIGFKLDADAAGASGELFRMHGSFSAGVSKTGELQVMIFQDGAPFVLLNTSGAKLNSVANRDKNVLIDLDDGQLKVWVDGVLEGQAKVAKDVGGAAGFNSHNLVFGNPWGGANFNGDISNFEISVGASGFPAQPSTTVIIKEPPPLVIIKEPPPTADMGDQKIIELNDDSFVAYDEVAIKLAPLAKMTDEGLQLGATGVTATVDRKHVAEVIGSDDMTISFSLDADQKGASGNLFGLHGSFIADVSPTGELVFRMFRDDQPVAWLTTKGAGLNNGAEHDVVVNLEDGRLEVWVDGTVKGSMDNLGVVGGAVGFRTHNLSFGDPWGARNFNGDLKAFEISVGRDDGPALTATSAMEGGLTKSALNTTGFLGIARSDNVIDSPFEFLVQTEPDFYI